jgi:hypothetical protein
VAAFATDAARLDLSLPSAIRGGRNIPAAVAAVLLPLGLPHQPEVAPERQRGDDKHQHKSLAATNLQQESGRHGLSPAKIASLLRSRAMLTRLIIFVLLTTICEMNVCAAQTPVPKIAVTTYHYDNLRTGWNSHEGVLNPTLCPPWPRCFFERFGLVKDVQLDDTVYAQPLVVPDIMISASKHDVVYVVTESNTIYAIDANNGSIILPARNLGPAVPRPSGCANNGQQVGIESTPVIDLTTNTMYLVSYTMLAGGQPAYLLHAIDLTTLADRMTPTVVAASHKLVDGSSFSFNASDQRQRSALLLEDGNIYAAFASWCDQTPARGWLLGWRAIDLQPLAANILTDQRPVSASNKLSSIWMSGYGVAATGGHLYFATGNSIWTTYNDTDNFSESVVKVSADLSSVLDFFTPSNVNGLDHYDEDLGSGGVLLLPDQPGSVPRLAVAAGKAGWMYLLNRTNMGKFSDLADNVVGQYPIGPCWCGQSYYQNNVVSSGGTQIGVWHVDTSPSTGLTQIHTSDIATGGDGGFFTAVSSDGAQNVIIWAVSRRNSKAGGPEPTLYAFTPIPGNPQLKQIFMGQAGNWDVPPTTSDGANSNIVPVVANGHVYVASYQHLDIFGFTQPVVEVGVPSGPGPRFGIITKLDGSRFVMKTEAGEEIHVDAEAAVKNGLSPPLTNDIGVSVYGVTDGQGLLHAEVIRPVHTPKPH